MLAAHADQENLIHAQHTTGAAKSLNRSFGAKTPSNAKVPKTPFRRNDENASFRVNGKSAFKAIGGKETSGTVRSRPGKAEPIAFVTPAGPRNRAPLGFKTTNAKANAFQTPAPLTVDGRSEKTTQRKTVSPRLRRKIKIHEPETLMLSDVESKVPEPEYMPPRSIPLPDVPSDDEDFLSPNHKFPQFAPENLTRGWARHYMNPVDDRGVSYLERKEAAEKAAHDKYVDEMLERAMNEAFRDTEEALREEMGISPKKSAVQEQGASTSPLKPKPLKFAHAPSTVMAKSAASVLNKPTKAMPSYATPTSTAAAKAKTPSGSAGLFGKKIRESAKAEGIPVGRHGAALAASRSTLGYGQGRAVSQKMKKPGDAATQLRDLHKPRSVSGPASSGSGPAGKENLRSTKAAMARARKAEEELRLRVLTEEDEDDVFGTFGGPSDDFFDNEYDEFQLELPRFK